MENWFLEIILNIGKKRGFIHNMKEFQKIP
jgi:hypothetical protein